MPKKLEPLPVQEDAALKQIDDLGSDFASTDFDGALKASTATAKAKSLKDFPGEHPSESDPVVASGNVDDDALVAAVTTAPAAEPTPPVDSGKPVAAEAAAQASAAAPLAEPRPAAEAAPAKAEPRTYDPGEKFAIADGVEVTREQLTRGLQERQQWGQGLNRFAQVFRCTPEQAEQYWKPYVDRLAADPKVGEYVDSAISEYDNPAKREYVEKCRRFFDEQTPAAAQPQTRPQPAAVDPAIAKELAESRAFRAQYEADRAKQQVASETQELTRLHPQLADPNLMRLVATQCFAVLAEQQRTGVAQTYNLTQATRDMQHVIDKWGAPAAAAAPAPVVVPALNRSSGPGASTRIAPDMKPKKFASPDDALADWATNVAPQLGYS